MKRRSTEAINITRARLCLDCESIHQAECCPVCSSNTWHYVQEWIDQSELKRTWRSNFNRKVSQLAAVGRCT